jgi:XapX domain-containing protein
MTRPFSHWAGGKASADPRQSGMSDQAISLSAVLLAFATGLAVGIVFSLVKLPSPAPPFLGLIGLVGMFAGQRLWPFLASRFFQH